MQELIMVTILPAFVILTAFLFNIGTKETIDFRHGLNTGYFNPIAWIISFLYLFCLFGGIMIVKLIYNEIEVNGSHILIPVTVIILSIIYGWIYSKFNKKQNEIFIKKDQYTPNKKEYNRFIYGGIILIIVLSIWIFWILKVEFKSIYDMLISKSKPIDDFFLISFFAVWFILYSITIITAGYIYNYGKLFNFKRYRLVFTEEFKPVLNELDIKNEKDAIDVYVLVESEESMRIKIDKENLPSIIIKKEHILNLLFIAEGQTSHAEEIKETRWILIVKSIKSAIKFIRYGYLLEYTDFEKYENYKLNQDNIENIVEMMEIDYSKMKDKDKKIIELKLKDMKAEIDKSALISIIIAIYSQLLSNIFNIFDEKIATIARTSILILIYTIIARYIIKIIRLYRVFNLYLDVINIIKNNNLIHDNSNLDEETKDYVIRIKEI